MLPFWYFENDLATGAKHGFCPQIWCFIVFLGFSSEDEFFRIQLHNGDLRKGMIIMLLIAIVIFILFWQDTLV